MYDLMAGHRTVPHHQRLSPAQVAEYAPTLVREGLEPSFVYYDGQTDDARLTLAVLATAAKGGALIANHAEVVGLLEDGLTVTGARVRDHLTGDEISIQARYVVNAGGIFSERIAALGEASLPVQVLPSKGVHLVLDRALLGLSDHAVVLPQTSDGRILFIVPWKARVVFGTTDTGSGDLEHPRATEEDIDYLLEHLNHYSSVTVTRADILSVYAGYRPLLEHKGNKASSKQLSRTHVVIESQPHFISIFGGKLTTYRRMAQDAMDVISKHDGKPTSQVTKRIALAGSENWANYAATLTHDAAALGLSLDIAKHLGATYGTLASEVLSLIAGDRSLGERLIPDLPYLRAEVVHAARAEMALTLEDVLAQRTSIVLEDRHQGGEILDDVADLLAGELGWAPAERTAQIAAYHRFSAEYAVVPARADAGVAT
jgi:glycerol-3-phosphate dehydrogenase